MSSIFERDIGSGKIVIESGKLALQAHGSLTITYGETVLLVTAVASKPREGIDFFPLTIDVEERLYSRGKIPGSFFRREGRPSTPGILMARLIDRPVRPLFPKGYRQEVQIVITPLSVDLETPFETLGIIGASIALSISDIPFEGPIAATRMGYIDDELVANPTYEQLNESKLDLVVASSKDGVIMMEAGAEEVAEDVVFEAIRLAHEVNLDLIDFQQDIIESIGKPKSDNWQSFAYPDELDGLVGGILGNKVVEAFSSSTGKQDLEDKLNVLRTEVVEALSEEHQTNHIREAFETQLEHAFKSNVFAGGKRPDGRDRREIRPISSEVSLLPRTHGTGLFNRGETQILAVVTLGSVGDAQRMDTLTPDEKKRFMLHYNFPPYSVGEARRIGSPGRREIGHGMLAERALSAVLPSEEDFPYTLRIVCEALGSNGSTSMASVCASTLALLDAGVPIKTPVAGISVGLITSEDSDEYITITDIQGMEDHVGDMDFKVAGTANGITAIQLDIKVKSISFDVVKDTLEQAKEARLIILENIRETISETRQEMSPYAPRMLQIKIPVDKIGAVIGPGGKVIRSIQEATGATIDIQDDGTVIVGSPDGEAAAKAIQMIDDLTREIKAGEIFDGKVVRIMDFGAFVELLPGKDGLVHISELADYHVPNVTDVVQIGDAVKVIVKEIDSMGRINLSRKALLTGDDAEGGERPSGGGPSSGGGGGQGRPEGRPEGRDNRPDGRNGGDGGGRGGYRGGGGGGRPGGGGNRGGPPRQGGGGGGAGGYGRPPQSS